MSERKVWTPADVVDVSGPPALLRNYLEQRDVRDHLTQASLGGPITSSCRSRHSSGSLYQMRSRSS